MSETESAQDGLALVAAELVAPATAVTVMEDRARVTRRGQVSLKAGRQRLQVMSVAPVLVDKTLVVVAESEGNTPRVVDARVLRKIVNSSSSEAEQGSEASTLASELRAEHIALKREMETLAAELQRDELRAQRILRTSRMTLADAAEDASYGKVVSNTIDEELTDLRTRYLELIDVLVAKRALLADKSETLGRLDTRIAGLEPPADREWACIEIDLESTGACEAQVQIDYAVPSACWRPYHRARLLSGETTRVEFRTDACVWQHTGEDWQDVELTLSTERSSLGSEPPTLQTDTLMPQRKSSTVHIEAREQTIESVPQAGGAPARAELPGIDDGGQALNLRTQGKCSLPSDGRPHRLFLSEFEAEAQSELVAMPEVNAAVLLATNFENGGDAPLLAGPVDLLRDSGLVGRSKIMYVAGGERFDLGWGPVADLRIRREVDQSSETTRALSSWNTKTYTAKVKLSNLGQEAYRLRVVERVPVSEIDKVKIDVDTKATTGGKNCDVNGFVEWMVDLAPKSHQEIELCYVVKKHDDVVG